MKKHSDYIRILTLLVSGDTMPKIKKRKFRNFGNFDIIDAFHNNTELEKNEALIRTMEQVDDRLVRYEAGNNIMTDDKAPVELLSMKAIDGLISNETSYYKDLYDREGLEGLLNELS